MTAVEIASRLATHDRHLEEIDTALERGRDAQAHLREDVSALQAWRWYIGGGLALVAIEIPIALWIVSQLVRR